MHKTSLFRVSTLVPVQLVVALSAVLLSATSLSAQPIHLNLSNLFSVDTVLEPGGNALSDPLDPERQRIDGQTLPPTYSDGHVFASADGLASFLFAPLKTSSLDALLVDGQTLAVPAGKYATASFALLSAPYSYADPFTSVVFRYTDGSTSESRFGPVPGWLVSPIAFTHSFYSFTDSSGVQSLISFAADWSMEEAQYLIDSRGNGDAGGVRFVDGNGFALYSLTLPADATEATLGITVGNNFVISLASEYSDPWVSTDGYTEVANSMTIYDGFDHHALGNLKLYEFSLKPFLTNGTGQIYLLFTDATPATGWGPYIQTIRVYTGSNRIFAEDLAPVLNTDSATLYAEFRADGGAPEVPYLYDNSGSGPSNRKHRFADGTGSLTYRFDFPDTVTDAKLAIDLANNFVVNITGPLASTRYAQATPGAPDENTFLIDAGNSALGSNFRFADASAYMIYQFDLPDDIVNATAQISVGNQFVIEVASGLSGPFVKVRDYVAETGIEVRDNSNLAVQNVDLASYLASNPQKIVRIRLSDGVPADGWGPYLTGITIVDQPDVEPEWTKVLDSMALFGVDVHNEANKNYYTIDLSPVLNENNAKKEVYVRFTDGSTGDGWGPGIFWMAAYSGNLEIQSDGVVFEGLKALNGEPQGPGLTVVRRTYGLDVSKTLKEIVLPSANVAQDSKAYLMAATLAPLKQPVTLSVPQVAVGSLILAWPASASEYHLESANSLSGPWTSVEGAIQVVGDEARLTVPMSGTSQFYRLKK